MLRQAGCSCYGYTHAHVYVCTGWYGAVLSSGGVTLQSYSRSQHSSAPSRQSCHQLGAIGRLQVTVPTALLGYSC